MPFKKGDPKPANAGRLRGTPNKTTVLVKQIIEDTAIELGGLARLLQWVKERPENEYAFWTSMFMRLLPVQLMGSGKDGALVVEFKKEELAKRLEERGLPSFVFGIDVPTLELTAAREELGELGAPDTGNGRDRAR